MYTSHPESGRIRLVDRWKPPKFDFHVNIEVATERDAELTYDFLRTDSRTSEPTCVASNISEDEVSATFLDINRRSVGSGLSLLMLRDDTKELIGIRMTSISERPKDLIKKEFVLLPDYKEVIDRQPSNNRKEKRLLALLEIVYGQGPMFMPECDKYFTMEIIGIKKQYRLGNLATPLVHEMFKLAASKGIRYGEVVCTAKASQHVSKKLGMKTVLEIPYDKFLDNGVAFYLNTPDKSTEAQLMIADLKEMGYDVKEAK